MRKREQEKRARGTRQPPRNQAPRRATPMQGSRNVRCELVVPLARSSPCSGRCLEAQVSGTSVSWGAPYPPYHSAEAAAAARNAAHVASAAARGASEDRSPVGASVVT